MKIGIISDTHGKIPAEIFEIFKTVDEIWHASDIGNMDVVSELKSIAPLLAVCGNMDGFPLISLFQKMETFSINEKKIFWFTNILMTETGYWEGIYT